MATDSATATPPQAGEAPAPVAAPSEPAPPTPQAPKKAPKAGKAAKQPKAGKGATDAKESKGAGADEAVEDGPSVAAHPRAARAVARAKGWGGLLGFVIGGYMSLPTNTLAAAGLRALVAGVICYLAVWAGAVFVWRRLVMLEIKSRQQQLLGGAPREHPAGRGEPSSARASS